MKKKFKEPRSKPPIYSEWGLMISLSFDPMVHLTEHLEYETDTGTDLGFLL